jgi:hypothetical protein
MAEENLFNRVLVAEMRLQARPERVFPLLCPVREAEWLPGWRAELVHSRSGLAELGCVFTTRDEDGRERVWTVSRHEPDAGIVQFVQFLAGLAVIRLDIRVVPEGSGSRARWSYAVMGLAPGREDFFAAYGEAPFQARMDRLRGLLDGFCA